MRNRRCWPAGIVALALGMPLARAHAADRDAHAAPDPAACVDIADAATRLACYDRAMRHRAATPPAQTRAVFAHEPATAPASTSAPRPSSLLDSRWELDPDDKQGAFHIRAYKPVYLLPFFVTGNTNQTPSSPAPGRTVTTPRDLQAFEAVYQLSLKTKLWENIFGGNGDLWTGYTQVSHWQLYHGHESRPFSETDYEPDLTLAFRTSYNVFGWNGRLFGISADHQSNGQSKPLSRSWNRAILDIGFEREDWTLMLRPWWRIHENNDDNPDITDYMGRGDVQLVHIWHDQQFALMARHSLRGGDRSHGALQFDWAFPLAGELHGHVQAFDGYGQSLIDYNHRAWYLGVGLSLLEWY
ncbi:MAG: phospholipase A [Lysobacterales bacterium]